MRTNQQAVISAHPAGTGDPGSPLPASSPAVSVALLTAGIDKHYAYGLAAALGSQGAIIDVIGSDDLEGPELRGVAGATFLNLRGDQRSDAAFTRKLYRVSQYYAKLMRYAATSRAKIFHILWNNRFEFFDRTALMLYYKLLGKKIALTAHNINTEKRDAKDTRLNRLTLRVQYRLADQIFVHTEKMKAELASDFGVPENRVTIIPFGINNAVPRTELSPCEARRKLGIDTADKTILFFGRITPYKGLDYVLEALEKHLTKPDSYRLIIAGRVIPGYEEYGRRIESAIQQSRYRDRILVKTHFIPDEEIELYFKAADVLVLPYRHIYQSGVLFLGYSFGLPVIAAEVGSLKEDIVEEETGIVFRPGDVIDLAGAIERYFGSELFANLAGRRRKIEEFARTRHSWETVGELTMDAYGKLLDSRWPKARAV